MKLTRTLIRIVALLLVVAVSWPAAAQANEGFPGLASFADAESDRLLVGVEPGLSQENVAAQLAQAGLLLERYWPRMALASGVPISGQMSAASMYSLAQSDFATQTFRHVSPNQRVHAADMFEDLPEPPLVEPEPNDPLYGDQWALPIVQAVDAWNISRGSPQVVIAVIDTGYDAGHPDIDPVSVWTNEPEANGVSGIDDDGNGFVDDVHGWDWVDNDNDPNSPTPPLPSDNWGHGTHVMGVIVATTGNAIDIAGIGRGLVIAPLRILNSFGSGDVYDLVDAVDYAIEQQMDVINLSLTTEYENAALRDAMSAASAAGLSVIAAAGNDGYPHAYWPAAYPQVVAVAATDYRDRRALYSNYGPEIDLAAPGSSIVSLYPRSTSRTLSGTSMATPHVSALVGLLRSLRPELNHDQLVDLAKSTADDVNADAYPGEDVYLGAGRINLYQALLHASSGLTLRPVPAELESVDRGDAIELEVRVVAIPEGADAIPVEGAVAYARVFASSASADAAEVVPIERVLTNRNGTASFTIDSPAQAGDYVIRLQVGASSRNVPLVVVEPLAVIETNVQSQTLTVGDDRTPFTVRLLDSQGGLPTGETPIHLETTAGEFSGGHTSYDATAQDGVYSGILYAGTVAGSGRLTVSVDSRSGSSPVTVLPGAPAVIRLANTATHISAVDTVYDFEAVVEDHYGNSLDVIGVSTAATAGALKPSAALTTSVGTAVFDLTVPSYVTEPVLVSVEVAGFGLTDSLEVRTTRFWLPSTQK